MKLFNTVLKVLTHKHVQEICAVFWFSIGIVDMIQGQWWQFILDCFMFYVSIQLIQADKE